MLGKTIKSTIALAAAGNYTAKDVLSSSASAGSYSTFDDVGGSGYIMGARAICETAAVVMRATLLLFKAAPNASNQFNDNVASTALLEADWDNFLGAIEFPALKSYGGDGFAEAISGEGCKLPKFYNTPDGKIYYIAITEDAETNETAGDSITFYIDTQPSI